MKLSLHRIRALDRLLGWGVHMPAYLLFFVTHRCDAKCEHCFFWRQLNQPGFSELNLEEIEALARSIGPTLQVTLTGGSPELRHDLPQIAALFHQHCRPANLTFCFNGYHTDRILRMMQETLDLCPGQRVTVGISLDGVGDDHDRLRGMPGLFERASNTVRELSNLKAGAGRMQLIAGICVSELNHSHVGATAEWVGASLPVDVVKPILVRGDPRNPGAAGSNALRAYLRMVSKVSLPSNRQPGRSRSLFSRLVCAKEAVQRELISRIATGGDGLTRCAAARETAVVYADGEVEACELRSEKLGNLRDHQLDFRRIWYGPAASRFRASLVAKPCRCYHHCFLAPMIFRSPLLWPRLARAFLQGEPGSRR